MSGVSVHNGTRLDFSPEIALEWLILGFGATEARKRINSYMEITEDEEEQLFLMEMCQTPVIIPSNRAEVYSRAFWLIREIGAGLREELARINYPLYKFLHLTEAFFKGFFEVSGFFEKIEEDVEITQLFFFCGLFVANLINSIFPKDECEPMQVFDSTVSYFLNGIFVETSD